jgi:hypothetical protein
MTVYALASEYDRLTPAQRLRVDHILIDDGDWTEAMIAKAMGQQSLADQQFDDNQEAITNGDAAIY